MFVRFSGCNLRCLFCDTPHQTSVTMCMREIVDEVQRYPAKRVVLTGGEPLLQVGTGFVQTLKSEGLKVHIETNGTLPAPKGADWITVSPKENWVLKRGDELKVVYQGQDLTQYALGEFTHRYLQPCSESNYQEVVRICKESPTWKLSTQVHKLLKIQ